MTSPADEKSKALQGVLFIFFLGPVLLSFDDNNTLFRQTTIT